jgi:hypothetical protein
MDARGDEQGRHEPDGGSLTGRLFAEVRVARQRVFRSFRQLGEQGEVWADDPGLRNQPSDRARDVSE